MLRRALDALLQHLDGPLQAADGLLELEVEAVGDAELVVGLRDAPRVLRKQLLTTPQTRSQVLDGLGVILALDGDLPELHEGLVQPRLEPVEASR